MAAKIANSMGMRASVDRQNGERGTWFCAAAEPPSRPPKVYTGLCCHKRRIEMQISAMAIIEA
jgi:hypothetical protein